MLPQASFRPPWRKVIPSLRSKISCKRKRICLSPPPFITFALAAITFALTNAAWAQTEKVIYSFTDGSDGGYPEGGVIVDAKGNLYGTTELGGADYAIGANGDLYGTTSSGGASNYGVVFAVKPQSASGDLMACPGGTFVG
jgi:uncharacterized repeat protein (TIGR03803 family)